MTSKRGAKRTRGGRAASQGSMLERVVGFYHLTLAEGGEGMEHLTRLGLCDAGMVERFEIGYASGGLLQALPTRGDTRDRLTHLGLLEPDGTEQMLGCLTFPMTDVDGGLAGLCGLNVRTGATVDLPGSQPGLWNVPVASHYPELYLATSVADGLALVAAELPNVIAATTDALCKPDIEALAESGVTKLIVMGQKTRLDRLAARIAPFAVTRIELRQCLMRISAKLDSRIRSKVDTLSERSDAGGLTHRKVSSLSQDRVVFVSESRGSGTTLSPFSLFSPHPLGWMFPEACREGGRGSGSVTSCLCVFGWTHRPTRCGRRCGRAGRGSRRPRWRRR